MRPGLLAHAILESQRRVDGLADGVEREEVAVARVLQDLPAGQLGREREKFALIVESHFIGDTERIAFAGHDHVIVFG